MSEATIQALYRYPVKGFSPDILQQADIEPDNTIAGDRKYAVENGTRDFDPIDPKYFTKAKFLQLMTNEQLASLSTKFDASTDTLTILRNGRQVASGNLATPIGRQLIEQFLGAFLGSHARGAPRIVSAEGHHFSDVPDNFVSLINLATVRDIERVTGKNVDPLRFRANVYVDGWEPWFEHKLAGSMLSINGSSLMKVVEQITRCAAVNVDPATGSRDMQIPRTLSDVFGHENCGTYMLVVQAGQLSLGDTVSAIPAEASADRSFGI